MSPTSLGLKNKPCKFILKLKLISSLDYFSTLKTEATGWTTEGSEFKSQ
jgi:hypothetical protein